MDKWLENFLKEVEKEGGEGVCVVVFCIFFIFYMIPKCLFWTVPKTIGKVLLKMYNNRNSNPRKYGV